MEDLDKKLYKEAKARVEFKQHLRVYLAINILIWVFWYVMRAKGGHYDGYWPIYCSLGWGFGVFSHYISVYRKNENSIQKEMEKIKRERGLH